MRKILTLFILCLSVQICLAQKSLKIGIATEGGYYYPKNPHKYIADLESGYSASAGFWVMKEFHSRFSADIGLAFRKKTYKQTWKTHLNLERTEIYDESFPYPKISFSQDLLVIPLHIRFYPTRKLFITGGVEHAFMINLETDIKKDWEDNWLVGFGGQPGKLSWALTYSKGFKIKGATNIVDGEKLYISAYTNRIIQLSLFYPIWQKK